MLVKNSNKPILATLFFSATMAALPSLASAQNIDIQRATAADLESHVDDSLKAYVAYVNQVKIPEVAKTDPALAKDLKVFFNEVLPGKKHITRGQIGFEAVMQKVENAAQDTHHSLKEYSAVKIADLAFDIAKGMEQKRLAAADGTSTQAPSTH